MMRSTTLFAWFALSSFLSLGVGACRTDDGAPYPQLEARSDTRAGPSLSPEATAALVERFQAELDAAWTRAQETDEHFPGATAAFILPDGRVFGFATGHSDVDEAVLDDEPLFPAGQGYHYSDVHYTLAGLAIEEATGREYYDLLDEFFLDPFELELTLPADRRDLPGLAQGYAHASSELFGTPLEIVADGQMVIHPLQEWTSAFRPTARTRIWDTASGCTSGRASMG